MEMNVLLPGALCIVSMIISFANNVTIHVTEDIFFHEDSFTDTDTDTFFGFGVWDPAHPLTSF